MGNLIGAWQVRIKITFAVKFAEPGDLAVGQQSGNDRFADGFFVGNREGAGVAEADRAGEGVGFSAEFVGAGAEHFAFGADLDVYFQTDHSFVFHRKIILVVAYILFVIQMKETGLFMAVNSSDKDVSVKVGVPGRRFMRTLKLEPYGVAVLRRFGR